MNRLIKTISIFCCTTSFWVITFSNAAQVSSDFVIEFEDQSVSAKLKNASLVQVLEKIKQETGIWINLNASMHGKEVSIIFDDLTLEAAIKRILHNLNHILVYDRNKSLVGVYILDKKGPGAAQILHTDTNKEKGVRRTTTGDIVSRNPFQKNNPFQSFTKMPFPAETDGEFHKTENAVLPQSKDQEVGSSEISPGEDAPPFINPSDGAQQMKNPFAELTSQGFEDFRNEKATQEFENAFERNKPFSLENTDTPNLAPVPKDSLTEKNYKPDKNPFTQMSTPNP
jgi:hypothetical protein